VSRADEPGTGLDDLLASPTPQPGDVPEPESRPSRPPRGRLEAWLRGGKPGGEASVVGDDIDDTDGADDTDVAGAGHRGHGEAGDGRAPSPAGEGREDGTSEADGGETEPVEGDRLRSIPVELISPNSYQPRRHFEEDALDALAESISALGVLQPVIVRTVDGERFELVAGERRWRAAQRAGLGMIPALIRETGDQGALEQAIVENLHRQDLNALEEAAAYLELSEDFGLTQEQVAKGVGKSRSAVANALRLLQLPPAVQRLVIDGELSAGHARALLSLDDVEVQIRLAERSIDEELSVRQVEDAVRSMLGGRPGEARAEGRSGGKSVGALEIQMVLEERLETRVEVLESGRGGRLVIRFADGDDLDRIVGLIGDDG
jgi:ParB family chromosome partitioning protein